MYLKILKFFVKFSYFNHLLNNVNISKYFLTELIFTNFSSPVFYYKINKPRKAVKKKKKLYTINILYCNPV